MCERLTEFDELVVSWRLRHIQLVERIIGMRMGTGGSTGASYLKLTLDKKFFPRVVGGANVADWLRDSLSHSCTADPANESKTNKLQLIGAGLNGPLLAIQLVKRGFDGRNLRATAGHAARPHECRAGRSISRCRREGFTRCNRPGLWEGMEKIIIPMRGRMMHSAAGELTFQPYGKDDSEVINSISRAELDIALMDAAETRRSKIHFQQRCTGYRSSKTVRSAFATRKRRRDDESRVRSSDRLRRIGISHAQEMLKLNRFNFSQQYLDYGYKELTIPAGPGGRALA